MDSSLTVYRDNNYCWNEFLTTGPNDLLGYNLQRRTHAVALYLLRLELNVSLMTKLFCKHLKL